MKEKISKIIENPFVQGLGGWIALFTFIVTIIKFWYSLMINYPIYFIIFIITGFLVMPTVYSIHTYYYQRKEIKKIKEDIEIFKDQTCADFIIIESKVYAKTANIFHNLAYIHLYRGQENGMVP